MTIEKEIEALNYITRQLKYGYIDLGMNDEDELEVIEKAINKQIPKKPIHIYEVYPKHDWMLDKNGEIDMFAMSVGYCNGPRCRGCHHSECEHCNPDWDDDECVIDEHRCPSCNKDLMSILKFCGNCGQALDWNE